ncbi:glycine--tRNA ligase subunit beta [Vagococcus silagei]|uniref:Glycine--tRNA ligase beta subunit n=1 Tax=Vagococcus silagei TaxID=2508885 RepID=A0A4V3TV58_9ENTE|nr:glycine--tRNA ligase subunit beta [Vagococcus silagei]THB61679.1 glycine--tRNA ligase subunit beta [Vagococcus silagei]
MTQQFLLEIGLEEVPAHLVTPSMNQLETKIRTFLDENRLSFEEIEQFSTPRRFAFRVNGLAEKQTDIDEKAKGPAKKIAQDAEGNWTKAGLGFARGQGVDADALYFEDLKGVEYVFANKHEIGKPAADILPELMTVVPTLNFPVSMHWANYDYKFIRPVHWLVALLDDKVLPMSLFDVVSSNVSRGHRFLGADTTIESAASYENALEKECVMVSATKRKATIEAQINQIANENNWKVELDADLLEEVNNLVEYPTAFVGNFDEKYLAIPSEVLITSMKEHQRYFEVYSETGELMNHFISVRNGNRDHIETVAKGNEKVLLARLEDAEFFYNEDLKTTIDACLERLKAVTFHVKIGSMYEKMLRVQAISQYLGEFVNLTETELKHLSRASQIYKFDLVTNMVNEFPELQGIIGEKYALVQGEAIGVAQAIREHYLPNSSDSELPQSNIGAILAIADKLDTLFTFFTVGLSPKGSNDPYALRRQAYGIIRIIEDKGWEFPIGELQDKIVEIINNRSTQFGIKLDDNQEAINVFMKGRIKQWLLAKKIRHDIIEAVVESEQKDLSNMFEVANILRKQMSEEDFKATIESLTRVLNLAAKKESITIDINPDLFKNQSEKALYAAVEAIDTQIETLTLKEMFDELKKLTPLIQDYFEDTMVMIDDEKVKENRLSQLRKLANIVVPFANLEHLVVK